MSFLLVICLLMAGYAEQGLSVSAASSRAMIAKATSGEHSFSSVFRQLAATKDLGGMHRLLWNVRAKKIDRAQVYQLLLANDDDPKVADNSYRLLRKIIRNTKGRGQSAYIAKHIIADNLHDELYILSDKAVALYLSSLKAGEDGDSVDEKLILELTKAIVSFDKAYHDFSFIYLNVTQGSKQVGLAIRGYFDHQSKNIVKSLLDQPLSEQTRDAITGAHNNNFRDSVNTICSLANRCRRHGHRNKQFIELTEDLDRLSTNVGVSEIWH